MTRASTPAMSPGPTTGSETVTFSTLVVSATSISVAPAPDAAVCRPVEVAGRHRVGRGRRRNRVALRVEHDRLVRERPRGLGAERRDLPLQFDARVELLVWFRMERLVVAHLAVLSRCEEVGDVVDRG